MTIVDLARERIQANARGCLVPDDVEALTIESRLGIEELMLQLTPLAASFAMPPVSEFRVGAVVQGISGAMYLGANIEFLTCALNQTVHAEQAAVTNAAVHREASIIRLAVSAAP